MPTLLTTSSTGPFRVSSSATPTMSSRCRSASMTWQASVRKVSEQVGVLVDHGDLGPGQNEPLKDRLTDASSGAGDDSSPAREVLEELGDRREWLRLTGIVVTVHPHAQLTSPPDGACRHPERSRRRRCHLADNHQYFYRSARSSNRSRSRISKLRPPARMWPRDSRDRGTATPSAWPR